MKPGSLFSFAIVVVWMTVAVVAQAAAHPALVSGQATDCRSCHDEVFQQRPVLHPPAVDDCSSCHEVTIEEGRTGITLVEAEPALCLMCHSDLDQAGDLRLAAPHAPVGDSCLHCHDPHAAQAEHLLAGSTAEVCAGCHVAEDLDPVHDGQLLPTGDCSACHDAHGSDNERMLRGRFAHSPFAQGSCDACHRPPFAGRTRLRARDNSLCEACHGAMATSDSPTSEHAALQAQRGRSGCLNCHDPHLSDYPSMMTTSGPGVCRECHADVVQGAEASTGHAPAAEDCLTCHRPHTAEQRHLLSLPPESLCETCHDLGSPLLSRAHLGADPAGLVCRECHSPHGAGQPHLLEANVHPPAQEGCDLCHESATQNLIEGGGTALCSQCHDVAEVAAESALPHAALEVAECSECHNPHASAQTALVRQPGGEVCVSCHSEQEPAAGEVGHGVIDILGCQACHEPHGGGELLLRMRGPQLCLACHDPRRLWLGEGKMSTTVMDRFEMSADSVRAMATLRLSSDGQHDHPVKDHRVLGLLTEAELRQTDSTYRGEFTCLTCHDPHKGRSGLLLRWDAATAFEACAHCHTEKATG